MGLIENISERVCRAAAATERARMQVIVFLAYDLVINGEAEVEKLCRRTGDRGSRGRERARVRLMCLGTLNAVSQCPN